MMSIEDPSFHSIHNVRRNIEVARRLKMSGSISHHLAISPGGRQMRSGLKPPLGRSGPASEEGAAVHISAGDETPPEQGAPETSPNNKGQE